MAASEQVEWRPEATDYVLSLARIPREKLIQVEGEQEVCVLCSAKSEKLHTEDHKRYCPWLTAQHWAMVHNLAEENLYD